MDLDQPSYQAPDYFAVVNAMVFVHQSLYKCNAKIISKGLGKGGNCQGKGTS